MKQLRIYTLKDQAAAHEYLENHWTKHLVSLPKFGIHVEKVFGENNPSGNCRVFALVSSSQDNLHELNAKYMQSDAFKDDMQGFDMTKIVSVEDVDLFPGENISNLF
ncbi:hypothetical protein [Apilactobacillus ozensis]|uniref:NIPSNAP domain-containing protein n=1 Tax=Apilactobacillus ozensis DSM 23829 = JCM 17196 TaxID=1423781 RepID=A0A0R2AK64_9LACO|nr:hypothetical protein [Apilactobacillus ozensis]KRM67630.1 hypothetical protein FD06_GL000782 [Apilactobacillus ozensis DSM 23829 = JCM 17196]MCK8607268.1 hypothetical protein [Apilactobacillus ozensis]